MSHKQTDRGGYKSNANTDEKVMMSIVRTAELFKKKMGAIFKNYGLTFSQYNVLRILDTSTNGMNTITNVSRLMLVSGANMTGVAKRMEKNGFLIRRSDAKDERITLLEITPKGRETLKNIHKGKEDHLKEFMISASLNRKEQMLAELKQISKSLG
ncbi:MarR family transcriptional regulator [Desulfobacula sp.]|uniref:MarR family winged helix-turn-helix transcriptional regulator n=1 Tax=Desulfobacula sp. TaxID=2593537 RepID=UPI002619DFB0|nr:MarR family transcriptional regulator [Desulfobacula sp.]